MHMGVNYKVLKTRACHKQNEIKKYLAAYVSPYTTLIALKKSKMHTSSTKTGI